MLIFSVSAFSSVSYKEGLMEDPPTFNMSLSQHLTLLPSAKTRFPSKITSSSINPGFHPRNSYILDINPLSGLSFANIFYSVGCLFILLVVCILSISSIIATHYLHLIIICLTISTFLLYSQCVKVKVDRVRI